MPKPIRVWFPDFFTEAHRKFEHGQVLANELSKLGVECHLTPSRNRDVILCGSVWKNAKVQDVVRQPHYKHIPVVQYNWDIYPFQIEQWPTEIRVNPDVWPAYLRDLPNAREVWVPSECTVRRTLEFTACRTDRVVVVKCSVRPLDLTPDQVKTPGDTVVDVMRKYPDPNRYAVRRACEYLDLPFVETGAELPWDQYKAAIGRARVLVSANWECSTGGLSLLEGYWYGKPVLLSTSPRHGGGDYFGNKARYFDWDNYVSLRAQIKKMWYDTPVIEPAEAQAWITKEYSEAAFAARVAARLRAIL